MTDRNDVNGLDGIGEWTPGAYETERFREDLYLRIVGTAETMSGILDGHEETALLNLRTAASDGNLREERADVEMVAFCDSVEHSRFTYNWAHVMLTTRVLDTLKTWSSLLAECRPKGAYSGKGPILPLKSEFADRFGIDFSKCPTGDLFLEGMVIARNKIVHNGAMAWESSSGPARIVVEGENEKWSPSKFDQDFVDRFSEYVDTSGRITVTNVSFQANVERSLAFVTWVGEHLDLFVQLLAEPSAGRLPS